MELCNKIKKENKISLKVKSIFKARANQREFFYEKDKINFQGSGNFYFKI